MKKRCFVWLIMLLLLAGMALSEGSTATKGDALAADETTSGFSAFAGKRIAVQTGTISGEVAQAAIEDVRLDYYNSQTDCLAALRSGKADAWAADEPMARFMLIENTDLEIADRLDDASTAAVFAKTDAGQALCDRYGAFVDGLWADGTMEQIDAKWFGVDDSARTVPDYEALPDTNGTLRMAVDTSIIPFAYVKYNRVVGYDIDIAARFCEANGYRLEVVPMSFDGILPSVQTGKCDFAACCITVTQERTESVLFSSPTYHSGTVLTVLKEEDEGTAADIDAHISLDSLDDKRIGVQTGTICGALVESQLPEAQVYYFNTVTDVMAALETGKVDGGCMDEPTLRFLKIENPQLAILDEYLDESNLAAVFPKTEAGEALCDQYSDYLEKLWADGTMAEIDAVWFGEDDKKRTVMNYGSLPASNGTLRMAADLSMIPFTYMKDNRIMGYDVDVATRFCREYGYGLEIVPMEFGGILPAVQSGKCDFAASCITVTAERAESVLFSAPNYYGGIAMAMWKDDQDMGAQAAPAVRWQDYNGKRLGVLTGPLMEDAAAEYFPDSEYLIFNSYPDCIAALLAGKIDAYLGDEPSMKMLHAEQPDIDYIHERITENNYSFAFRKDDPESAALCAELNEFLAKSWVDGTIAELDDIWFGVDEDKKTVDMSDLTGENGTIRVVTTSTDAPFSYIKDGKNVGYDIDLVVRFCRDRGYALELGDVDFAGRIPAIESGKYDFTTDMNVTPEREEEVLFSDPTSKGGIVLAVRASDIAAVSADSTDTYTSLAQLDGKRIGVQTGTTFDEIVLGALPDAQISYFNSYPDMAAALEANKIDGFPGDEPVLRLMAAEDDKLTVLKETMDSFEFGFVLPKTEEGNKLLSEINAWLVEIKASGEMDEVVSKWTDGAESDKTLPDYAGSPAPNGTLIMATEGAYAPMNYYRGDEVVGFEIDLAARFCEAHGYGLKVEAMNFDGILPAVQAGKADFAAAGITITEERAESVNFSEPYYVGGTAMAVLKAEAVAVMETPVEAEDISSQGGIAASFNKTFIREGRWKLFLDGVLTTLLITLLSILFGTLLGFGVFMICRNGNIIANGVTRFCLWLVQGMPMVVLLMILYYIIFGSVAISGIAVAVIGFTLTFGAAVFGLLKMGVGAVDGGQYEAAYALGYSNRRTFFRIILPQALPHVLPAYKGEIVGLIKATAIVGYIAVQDLTKMGDIVRSRTYEAFFPLIAVTVIYFVLEGLIGFLVSRISVGFNPKRRKPADILKGVKTDD
ncbi:MAG: transporter substrate-binding domain-containing protein [Clostridia bacterium]|nr:transporter substrate-binding domain-containing protein [Clostridia bacterium]